MMRKIFVSVLLLVSGYVMAQPANYIPYASRNRYIALMADSTFHIPRFNGAPSLRVGGSTNDGALAADTANGRLYLYQGGSWSLMNKDTSNTFLNSLYKKTGTDSVFEIRGGTHTFAFTVGGGGSGGGIVSLGTSAYGLTIQNDSTYKADTIQLSTRLWRQKGIDSVQGNVNLKLNITDTANIKPRLYAGSNVTITGTYPDLTIASSGGGGADSSIFATQYRLDTVKSNRLRHSDTASMLTKYPRYSSLTSGQLVLANGTRNIYSSSKFVYSDATYPSFSIIGSDPLMYFGGTGAAYPSIGKSGGSTVMYGTSGGRSINFYDQLIGGRQMLRLYATAAGASAVFGKTALSIDTAVGGPSIGSVHVEYNAGDSTSSATDIGRHMFRGIGRTYANSGSFNTFYSTVEAGNTTYSQDHIIAWQSDAKKTGANTLGIIYHLGILGDSIKAGMVNHRWGVYMYDAKVLSGATLAEQTALRVPKLAAGVRNYDMFSDSAQTVKMDGNLLIGDSVLAASSRKTIHLFNGTAPSASATNGVILYAEDVSSSSELKVRDEAGNITTLSPHNFSRIPQGKSEDMAWSYYSEKDGKVINVDMLKSIRTIEQQSKEIEELKRLVAELLKKEYEKKEPVKLVNIAEKKID